MDLMQRFAGEVKLMMQRSTTMHQDLEITPDNVFQEANTVNRETMNALVGTLMLPGSRIEGGAHLKELAALSDAGKRCLIFSAHLSNMDVPSLCWLMTQAGPDFEAIFNRIMFMAGRKLNEESPEVKMFSEIYTRIVITPKSSTDNLPEGEEKERILREAQAINLAAHRVLKEKTAEGRILLVYPTGTRYRPWSPETGRGLREAEGYLRVFDHFCVGATLGNLMPPMQDTRMHIEYPREDRVVMRFSPVISTREFRERCRQEADALAAVGTPVDDFKQFTIDRVLEMIAAETAAIE